MKTVDFILIFLLGFFSCAFVFSLMFASDFEVPFGGGSDGDYENSAPSDWISEEDITLLDDKIIINVENAKISSYKPTGSMKPVLDEGANGIRIVPESADEIDVGDIISFRKNGILIVHRVVSKGVDSNGVYFVTRGDNNNYPDGKIRFDDVRYVTIGILY